MQDPDLNLARRTAALCRACARGRTARRSRRGRQGAPRRDSGRLRFFGGAASPWRRREQWW